MQIITVPFGYLLSWLYDLVNNYGVALILFSLIVKFILLPASIKSKKSSLKMARLAPQIKALEVECGEDKNKYQQEVSKLYKQEGIGCTGGCLWSLLPLFILIPLYQIIRQPIQYLMHIDAQTAKEIVQWIGAGTSLSGNEYYLEMEAASYIGANLEALKVAFPSVADKLKAIDFGFLGGLNLGQIPNWKFWTFFGAGATWANWGMFIIPLVSAGSQLITMLVSQKANNKVVTNDKGEEDKAAQETANSTNKTMMLVMPAMSLYFCFVMPAAISVYWFAQSVFGVLQDLVINKIYAKQYAEEDAKRREIAAQIAAKEAERERIRAERRAKLGEDGAVDPNTSKKKLKAQEEAAKKAAADAYAAAKNPQQEEETEEAPDKHFSGDPERPYCRGRNYKPNRYGRQED